MRKTVSLKRGLNLNLEGGIGNETPIALPLPARVALLPDDFPGFTPKLDVAEGDKVEAGSPLLHDKNDPRIRLVTPLAGTIEAVVRGARRKIERVVVKVDGTSAGETAKSAPFVEADADTIREKLMTSGLWAMMRRRPYDIIPYPTDMPRSVMVTALDTAPLAPQIDKVADGRRAVIEAGVKVLSKLTSGTIYIGVGSGSSFPDIPGAEVVEFTRLHPAGNPGIQIANIEPINKGEVVWTLDIVTLARIGHLALTGEPDWTTSVAVTGSEVVDPRMENTVIGAELSTVLKDELKSDGKHHRIISGNALTGTPETIDGFLRYPYRQVTVIPEGDDADEFMGWASMSPSKMSVSPSFLGHFLKRKFNPDARINGGRRAMIMSGEYDKVFPMDILPEYLIKAILARDIDRMEALGIYEVAPEDFALAEYVDPSKLELQKIVRDGLDYLRSEV
ncbi:MAG: Na(+)-translocating NADH-quinone reductase subunit A [Bacteroides sp.]|nr:Na(+)-translocating NADH-quinone reductase subunit A [Bacteroides sp.]